uniref:HelD family protein n=1 Tax=Candidatus Enterococcus willemsii TaxID=1857215 RepID=UPI00403F8871
MVNTELQKEKHYLSHVYQQLLQTEELLTKLIQTAKTDGLLSLKEMGKDISLNFDSVLDNLDTFSMIEMKNREIDQMNIRIQTSEQTLQKVQQLLLSPYFGKITLNFSAEETDEAFYFGRHNFTDETGNTLIFDWRSPIAETYYNNLIGPSYYEANQQQIPVTIRNRRQFLIEKDQLLQYFDTSVAIQDDILLEALKQDTTHYMQDITATIQTEQNKIIRDRKHDIVLVNGVAGSGKTSTIMQRIAYLLYSLRQEMSADNCLILSPNHRFIDYISNVLPSLGEQSPLNVTILQFLKQYLSVPLEDENQYFSRISQQSNDTQTETLRSLSFIDFIKTTTHTLRPEEFIQDIRYKKRVLIRKETIINYYHETPLHASVQDRMQATKKRITSDWQRHLFKQAKSTNIQTQLLDLSEEQQRHFFGELISDDSEHHLQRYAEQLLKKKYRSIQTQIDSFAWVDLVSIYEMLLAAYQGTNNPLTAPYTVDEAVIFVLIRHVLIEKIDTSQTKYLFIDEVQDYTPAQIALLNELFPTAHFTMVGDENQAIFNSYSTFEHIAQQFAHRQSVITYPLLYSYRSTGAITQLFNQLTTQDISIIPIRPLGQAPNFIQIDPATDLNELVREIARDNQTTTLTLLTKTADQAADVRALLPTTITVLPISLAKGLEFDHVVLYDVSDENYYTERDKKILYTAISRSMQTLTILYTNQFPQWL